MNQKEDEKKAGQNAKIFEKGKTVENPWNTLRTEMEKNGTKTGGALCYTVNAEREQKAHFPDTEQKGNRSFLSVL